MRRLIYVSKSSQDNTWDTVHGILAHSQRNNVERGLTGFLLATEHSFFQYLEGGLEEVNDLFFRIVGDPRHQDVRLISFTAGTQRLFPEWEMRGVGLFESDDSTVAVVKSLMVEKDGKLEFPEDPEVAMGIVALLAGERER